MQRIAAYATGFRSYLKPVLRYKFVILDTYYPDTLYVCEQWCQDLWLFFEARRGPWAKMFWKTLL